jgi:hypothetical protein
LAPSITSPLVSTDFPIDVAADDHASDQELRAVEAAFMAVGLEVRAEAAVGRKSAEVLDWVIYVTLGAPVAAFFAAFATKAGEDAYSGLKTWAKGVWDARRGAGSGKGSIVLRDPDHTNVSLHSSIPDEALDALERMDWSLVRGEYLVWSDADAEWFDPLKRSSDG